jgi:tRNA-dihydrouridine synthase
MISLAELTQRKLWLAPLAGYTDSAFRQLCKQGGAEVLVSEMVSADGLIRDSQKTVQFIRFEEAERPFGIQIFGSEPAVLAGARNSACASSRILSTSTWAAR